MTTPPTRPRLLVLHPSDELYGADRVLLQVVDALRGRVEPVVILPTDVPRGELSEAFDSRGVTVHRLALPILRRRYFSAAIVGVALRAPLAVARAVRLGRRHRVVAVHTNTSAVLVGPLIAALLRVPHVWHIHEIVERPRWLGRLIARVTRVRQRRVVVISQAVRDRLVRDGGRVTDVVLNAAPTWPRRTPPAPGGSPTVLLVGRVNGWKGHDVFVEAAQSLHATLPAARFRMVGGPVPGADGPWLEVQARVRSIDPAGAWLQLPGWSGEVAAELEACTVAVFPSTAPEPLNISALEAMAVGRPVVASRSGGLPEIVEDGETGLLVPPGDAPALAAAIARLLESQVLRARLVDGATERLGRQFGAERYAGGWQRIYDEAVLGRPANR